MEPKICPACVSGHHDECPTNCLDNGESYVCGCKVCADKDAPRVQASLPKSPKNFQVKPEALYLD